NAPVDRQHDRLAADRTVVAAVLHHAAAGGRLPGAALHAGRALVDADAGRLRVEPVPPRHLLRVAAARHVRPVAGGAAVHLVDVLVAEPGKRGAPLVDHRVRLAAADHRHAAAAG